MPRKNPHAVALGRRGGKVSSPAKRKAVARNAKLGGRPPKHVSRALWRRVRDRAREDGVSLEQLVPALYEQYVVAFVAPCPNGHLASQGYSVKELRERFEAGVLEFYCIICDEPWNPSKKEKANLQRWLDEHAT